MHRERQGFADHSILGFVFWAFSQNKSGLVIVATAMIAEEQPAKYGYLTCLSHVRL